MYMCRYVWTGVLMTVCKGLIPDEVLWTFPLLPTYPLLVHAVTFITKRAPLFKHPVSHRMISVCMDFKKNIVLPVAWYSPDSPLSELRCR